MRPLILSVTLMVFKIIKKNNYTCLNAITERAVRAVQLTAWLRLSCSVKLLSRAQVDRGSFGTGETLLLTYGLFIEVVRYRSRSYV